MRAAILEDVPAPDEFDKANAELRELIGDVTLTMADIEDSLDELILDLLSRPPLFSFFKRRVLGRWMVSAKIELLIAYGEEFAEVVTDADTALGLLRDIKGMAVERNRLIHDLHDVDIDDGQVTRRRIWEEDYKAVDLGAYRELAERLTILADPGMEAIADGLMIRMS